MSALVWKKRVSLTLLLQDAASVFKPSEDDSAGDGADA
jgi:hypothetical protein